MEEERAHPALSFFFSLSTAVAFRKKASLSAGRPCASSQRLCGLKIVAPPPQDKEGSGSDTSHAENARIFKESRPFASSYS